MLQSKGSKARNLCGTKRWLNEPGDDAPDIDRGGCNGVLELRFWSSEVAGLPQITDAHGLRDGAFDPSTNRALL